MSETENDEKPPYWPTDSWEEYDAWQARRIEVLRRDCMPTPNAHFPPVSETPLDIDAIWHGMSDAERAELGRLAVAVVACGWVEFYAASTERPVSKLAGLLKTMWVKKLETGVVPHVFRRALQGFSWRLPEAPRCLASMHYYADPLVAAKDEVSVGRQQKLDRIQQQHLLMCRVANSKPPRRRRKKQA